MSAGDLAAIVVSVVSLGVVVGVTLVLVTLRRTITELSATLTEVRDQALPALSEATEALVATRGEVDRVGEILDAAEAVSTRIDGASRAAYLAVSRPVIRTAAVASGTRRAARRLRGPGEVDHGANGVDHGANGVDDREERR